MDISSRIRYAEEILLEYESSGRTIVLESGINVLTDFLDAQLEQSEGAEPQVLNREEHAELHYWLGKLLLACCGFLFAPYSAPLLTVERAINCFASAAGLSGPVDCLNFSEPISALSGYSSSNHSSKTRTCEALVFFSLVLAYRYSHPDMNETDPESSPIDGYEAQTSLGQSFSAINAVLENMPEHDANVRILALSAHAFILWTEYNDTQDPITLDAAIDAAIDAAKDTRHCNGTSVEFALACLAYLLHLRAAESEAPDIKDIEQSIESYSQALALIHPLHFGRFDIIACFVETLHTQEQVSRQLSVIDKQIELLKSFPDAVDKLDLPRKTAWEEYMARAYNRRYDMTADLEDLNHAITHYKRAVESPFASNMSRYSLAHTLGALCTVECSGTEQDIQNGLENAELALDMYDLGLELDSRTSFVMIYGAHLSETYLANPHVDHIDRLIVLFESSLRCQNLTAEDMDYARMIRRLMDHLVTKFVSSREDTIFDDALNRLLHMARDPSDVQIVQADAYAHIGDLYRHKHSYALESKAEHHLISSLYHAALDSYKLGLGRLTINITPECDLFLFLCDRIIVVHENHLKYDDNSEILNEIIGVSRRALEVSENLGDNAYLQQASEHWENLRKRSWATKALPDLDEQVEFADTITQLPWLEQIPDRHRFYDIAAKSHMARFYRTGKQFDIDSAVNLELHAVHLTSNEKDRRVRESVYDLAAYLTTRFRIQWHDSDIRQAQQLLRTASTKPEDDLTCGITLGNLGSASALAYLQYHDRNDYYSALRSFREAIRLLSAADHSTSELKSAALSNLGGLLVHNSTSETALQEAVSVSRQACALSPESAAAHYNVVTALDGLYDLSGNGHYLLEAIAAILQAQPIFDADYRAVTVKIRLGDLYGKLYGLNQLPEDLEKSIDIFRQVARSDQEEPNDRFDAAKSWATLSDAHNHPSSFEAYSTAIELLPELLLHTADIMGRFRMATTRFRGLSSKATQCALRSGRLVQAVEMMEYGRSLFWQKTLELHLPLDELLERNPDLGTELRHVTQSLYETSLAVRYPESFTSGKTLWLLEQHRQDVKALSDRRTQLIQKARQLPGFENFARPLKFEQLKLVAQRGTVVMLHSSEERCSAIILQDMPERALLEAVDLPGVTPAMLQALSSGLYGSLKLHGRNAREFHATTQDADEHLARNFKRINRKPTEAVIEECLAKLWDSVALPVLRAAKLEPCGQPKHRLWWIPTGPFALLPLHAAGNYSSRQGSCLSDYVVPSYALNLSSLLPTRGQLSKASQKPSVLSVWQSECREPLPPLPMTRVESQKLSEIMNARDIPVKSLGDNQATVVEVVAAMKVANIVHFACHGKHDAVDPLRSAVALVDGDLTVGELMKHHSDSSTFVFLSACTTAQNVSEAADEPLHMASAFNFGGFKSVVATSWAIDDRDGPVIAEAVYQAMTVHKGSVDVNKAAFGLQDGIRRLRGSEKASFSRWVPFIHMGI